MSEKHIDDKDLLTHWNVAGDLPDYSEFSDHATMPGNIRQKLETHWAKLSSSGAAEVPAKFSNFMEHLKDNATVEGKEPDKFDFMLEAWAIEFLCKVEARKPAIQLTAEQKELAESALPFFLQDATQLRPAKRQKQV